MAVECMMFVKSTDMVAPRRYKFRPLTMSPTEPNGRKTRADHADINTDSHESHLPNNTKQDVYAGVSMTFPKFMSRGVDQTVGGQP